MTEGLLSGPAQVPGEQMALEANRTLHLYLVNHIFDASFAFLTLQKADQCLLVSLQLRKHLHACRMTQQGAAGFQCGIRKASGREEGGDAGPHAVLPGRLRLQPAVPSEHIVPCPALCSLVDLQQQ